MFLKEKILEKFKNQTCLLRVDLNVDDKKLTLKSNPRLKAIIPTLKMLLKNKINVIIFSHRGRPLKNLSFKDFLAQKENKKNLKIDKHLSLRSFCRPISDEVKLPVYFFKISEFIKINESKNKFINEKEPFIFLLENLRFFKEEEKNDINFAKFLAQLGDFYINDAFALSHRKNASIVAIVNYLPAYFGPLFEKEINSLNLVMKKFSHPFTIIIGGAKIKDKIGIINYFLKKADYFLLGGGPANTFLKAKGLKVGKSLVDNEALNNLKKYLNNKKIICPFDFKVKSSRILDIGPKTLLEYDKIIQKSKTIIWNGPMGFFEKKGYEVGTFGIWKSILKNKKAKIIVVGGGETLASFENFKFQIPNIKFSKNIFISTGGGAMLEYLSGKKLPGIEAILRKYKEIK